MAAGSAAGSISNLAADDDSAKSDISIAIKSKDSLNRVKRFPFAGAPHVTKSLSKTAPDSHGLLQSWLT